MTITAPNIITKIDDFSVAVSISELSGLAAGLLQLQHARYPHLVPMYRTVHRTKPRALVLRAIRWVNPKRMFPGAGLTKEEMENMPKEKLEELIVKLNDYRGEAHVIHNRYNQMIDMINMGELPYFIPYAGFKQDKWSMLQEYMDRAVRLKDGTKEWEHTLDRQALEIREILNKKHDTKLDDIEGLWKDAKGNDAAPNFMDIKKGKEAKRLLRQNRITPDGKRVKHAPKVYVRRFIAVPEAERRRGEEIRMPAGGRVRRPGRNDPAGRKVFDAHGGAAGHLVRVPKGPFIGTDLDDLREKGQLLSMPAGRKDPKILAFSEVSDADVANRRLARWTHTDPMGMRGRAPHRGFSSRGRQGSVAQEGPSPHARSVDETREREAARIRQAGEVRDREARLRQQRGQPARPARPARPAEPSDVQQRAKDVNERFMNGATNLFKRYGIDSTNLNIMKSITEGDIQKIKNQGGGINGAATLAMTLKNGKKYVYKLVEGEQKSEQLANVIDKLFDLNTQVDAVIAPPISMDFIEGQGISVRSLRSVAQRGGGHLQAWCEPNCATWDALGHNKQRELMGKEDFREQYYRMVMLDFIGGNWDRHQQNFMVTEDGKLQGIDNGFLAKFASVHQPGPIEYSGELFATAHGGAGARKPMKGIFSPAVAKSEAEAVFDRHFDEEKLAAIQQEFGMTNAREGQSFEEIKAAYLDVIEKIM